MSPRGQEKDEDSEEQESSNSIEDNFAHLQNQRVGNVLSSIAESKGEYERNTYEPGQMDPAELRKRVSFMHK